MFKIIKKIIIFIMAAFVALFLFACVDVIVNPVDSSNTTQEESKQKEDPTQEEVEKAKADAELKKREQKEREKEAAIEASSPSEQDKSKLVNAVEPLIPAKYKDSMYYDVQALTPTDTSLNGLIIKMTLVNGLFNEEKDCRDAAATILERIKDVPNISIVEMRFFEGNNWNYNLTIENWETYKDKGIDKNTLNFIKQD